MKYEGGPGTDDHTNALFVVVSPADTGGDYIRMYGSSKMYYTDL